MYITFRPGQLGDIITVTNAKRPLLDKYPVLKLRYLRVYPT